jgi:hypothetical protein
MNEDPRKAQFQKAIAEWKKKYHVGSNDPLMATMELWEILVENSRAADPSQVFRQELEKLAELGKNFSKQSVELISELRAVPKIKHDLWLFPYFTVILVAVAALIIGIFIGRLFLK